MILSRAGRVAGGFALSHPSLVCVKLQQHVGALTHLSLLVEHEAAAEGVDLAIEGNRSVTLPPQQRLRARVRDSLPNNLVADHLGADDLLARIVI